MIVTAKSANASWHKGKSMSMVVRTVAIRCESHRAIAHLAFCTVYIEDCVSCAGITLGGLLPLKIYSESYSACVSRANAVAVLLMHCGTPEGVGTTCNSLWPAARQRRAYTTFVSRLLADDVVQARCLSRAACKFFDSGRVQTAARRIFHNRNL